MRTSSCKLATTYPQTVANKQLPRRVYTEKSVGFSDNLTMLQWIQDLELWMPLASRLPEGVVVRRRNWVTFFDIPY